MLNFSSVSSVVNQKSVSAAIGVYLCVGGINAKASDLTVVKISCDVFRTLLLA